MKRNCFFALGFFFCIHLTDAATPGNLEPVIENSIQMKLVLIPAGSFIMGSPFEEKGRQDDETPHNIVIENPFYIGATEVTQSQWQAVMGFNRSQNKGDDLPVEKLSWNDAPCILSKVVAIRRQIIPAADRGGMGICLPRRVNHSVLRQCPR